MKEEPKAIRFSKELNINMVKRKQDRPGNLVPNHPTKFKKGQSGNPGGLTKDTIAKKVLTQFTEKSVAEAFSKMMEYSIDELQFILEEGKSPIIEEIVARCLLNDRKNSTSYNLERLLERVIGKIPIVTKGEYSGPGGIPLPATTIPPTQVVFSPVPVSHPTPVQGT